MRQPSPSTMKCSMARSLGVLGDLWAPLILRDLSYGLRHFSELAESLGISPSMMTNRLGRLVEAGLVTRTPYQLRQVRYDYRLSTSGRELVVVLMALAAWGDRWTSPDGRAPVSYQHKGCQRIFKPTVGCPWCGVPVTVDDIDLLAGPGALNGPGTMLHRHVLATRRPKSREPRLYLNDGVLSVLPPEVPIRPDPPDR